MENVNIETDEIVIDTVLDLSQTLHVLKILRSSLKYDIEPENIDISLDIRNDENKTLEITIRYSENIESMGIKYMPDTSYDIDIITKLEKEELTNKLTDIIYEIAKSFYYCNENCNEEDLDDCCKDKYIIEKLKEKGIKIE